MCRHIDTSVGTAWSGTTDFKPLFLEFELLEDSKTSNIFGEIALRYLVGECILFINGAEDSDPELRQLNMLRGALRMIATTERPIEGQHAKFTKVRWIQATPFRTVYELQSARC